MEHNKDKGTTVGFSIKDLGIIRGQYHVREGETLDEAVKRTNTEHLFFNACKKNKKIIESNVEDEFVKWLNEKIERWTNTYMGNPPELKILRQVKEKYLEIKSKQL